VIWFLVLTYAVLSPAVGLLVGRAIQVREAERPSPVEPSPVEPSTTEPSPVEAPREPASVV
jgi:hypothetical protein